MSNTRSLIFRYFRVDIVTTLRGVGGSAFGLAMASALVFTSTLPSIPVAHLTTGLAYFNLFSKARRATSARPPRDVRAAAVLLPRGRRKTPA